MQNKVCCHCSKEKNVELFGQANNAHKATGGRAHYCLECSDVLTPKQKAAIVSRLWRKNNREKHDKAHKDRSLKKTYNIGIEQYDEMLKAQNSVCAICGQASTAMNAKESRVRSLCVDHDHKTGAVRALLCLSCNAIVGHLERNPKRLELAKAYVEQHSK